MEIFGYILFSGGIGLLIAIAQSHKDVPWYLIIVVIVFMARGLEMIVNGKVNDVKEEIRSEIEELRSEINNNSSDGDWDRESL